MTDGHGIYGVSGKAGVRGSRLLMNFSATTTRTQRVTAVVGGGDSVANCRVSISGTMKPPLQKTQEGVLRVASLCKSSNGTQRFGKKNTVPQTGTSLNYVNWDVFPAFQSAS